MSIENYTYLPTLCYSRGNIAQGLAISIRFCSVLSFPTLPSCYKTLLLLFVSMLCFGRPCFLFPSGVNLNAALAKSSAVLLNKWPIHLHLLLYRSIDMSSDPIDWCNSLFMSLRGQNILMIFLRHELWKLGNLLVSRSVILQHSAPHNRTERTQLLYTFKFGTFTDVSGFPDVAKINKFTSCLSCS